jgi:2-phosphoglycerate kinase
VKLGNRTVVLIGGASGTGKSTVAKTIARQLGIDWLQIDDLRLALQHSNVRLPDDKATEALFFLERTDDVWQLPAERLRDGLISVGQAISDAIAIVIGNHIVQGDPVVIEGDSILPELVERDDLRVHIETDQLRTVFLRSASVQELLDAMIERGRGVPDKSEPDLHRIAEMNWLYSQWLQREATARSIPVISSIPRETLPHRVFNANP